ncbi:pilus assembly PilX family protein [Zooshikella sp. RANM57]|uniref:pilus assembly PilX family protein n=1 Tax=Zooshikella sp. RANM57 TaxID=3425863 RepID=UPI003D6DAE0A
MDTHKKAFHTPSKKRHQTITQQQYNLNKKNLSHMRKAYNKQQGIVLVISLVILLLLSIVGINAMMTTSLDEKMSANLKDHNTAFQAAEAALREGEETVDALVTLSVFNNDGDEGMYSLAAAKDSPWKTIDWSTSSKLRTLSTTMAGLADQPKYIIEHFTSVTSEEEELNLMNVGESTGSGATEVFRITARGVGTSAGSQVILQTTFAKRI